jgi:hypothetical protein
MPSFASKPWTPEEEGELIKLRESGVSLNRMAIRLRRTKRAISVRLADLRSRDSKTPPARHDEHSRTGLSR